MKKLISLILALAMVLSLAGCGSTDTSEASAESAASTSTAAAPETPAAEDTTAKAPAEAPTEASGDKTLTIGITTDITPLNCVDPTTEAAAWVNNILYPTLVTAVENDAGTLDVQWQLATDCTTEDNIHFTITLRDDIYWSDGEPVTAEDVVFAIDIFTNPDVGSTSMATFINMLEGITDSKSGNRDAGTELSGVEIIDDYTFQITTNGEYSADFIVTRLLYNLYALPKHILDGIAAADLIGSDQAYAQNVVYGAFSVDSYITGSELVLKANPDYYKGAPKLDYIRFVFLTSSQITSELASGEIDVAWPGSIDNADYEYITTLENVETTIGAPNSLCALFINCERISDVNVRKAISLAIDNESIVANVLKGYAELSNIPVSTTSKYYNEELAEVTYDPDTAAALLKESGFTDTIEISISSGKQTQKNVALLVEAYLEAVGFTCEIVEVDNSVMNCIMGEYDVTFITQTEQPLTPSHTLGIIVNNGWTKYQNDKASELFAALTAPATEDEVRQIMYDLEEIVTTDYPVVPIYNATALLAKNTRVTYGGPASYGMLADIELWDVQD